MPGGPLDLQYYMAQKEPQNNDSMVGKGVSLEPCIVMAN
jgi:hypothetical protein